MVFLLAKMLVFSPKKLGCWKSGVGCLLQGCQARPYRCHQPLHRCQPLLTTSYFPPPEKFTDCLEFFLIIFRGWLLQGCQARPYRCHQLPSLLHRWQPLLTTSYFIHHCLISFLDFFQNFCGKIKLAAYCVVLIGAKRLSLPQRWLDNLMLYTLYLSAVYSCQPLLTTSYFIHRRRQFVRQWHRISEE